MELAPSQRHSCLTEGAAPHCPADGCSGGDGEKEPRQAAGCCEEPEPVLLVQAVSPRAAPASQKDFPTQLGKEDRRVHPPLWAGGAKAAGLSCSQVIPH